MASTPDHQILDLVKRLGVVRPTNLEAHGIPRAQLYRLVAKGLLERRARGVYVASDHPYTAEHTLAQIAKRVPKGVVCLLTALRFHELTTQLPPEVWTALPEKARRPQIDNPRLRVTRFSGAALTAGIETHRIEGVDVRIYSAAKTVADCFKFRNKIGLDVVLEALREARRSKKVSADELRRYARINRVANVMRPYLEAVA
jgi:predicted transcriptional regulator of viral defense system